MRDTTNRWKCYYDPSWQQWILVDLYHPQVKEGCEIPTEAKTRLSEGMIAAILAVVPGKEAESRSFDKEVTRRHLDIIDKMLTV